MKKVITKSKSLIVKLACCAMVLLGLMTTNANAQTYCVSRATSTSYDEIVSVSFGTMTNSAPCGTLAPGPGSAASLYSNYTIGVAVPNVTVGASVSGSVTLIDCGFLSYGNVSYYVYIDWNQNGVFTDPGETAYYQQGVFATYSGGGNTYPFTITVPAGATLGNTVMRVIDDAITGIVPPCGTYTWGETEDYLINVVGTPCSGTPTAGTSSASVSSICGSGTSTLSLSGYSLNSGITFQWQQNVNGGGYTNISGATASTYTTGILNTSQTIQYQCVVTCSNGGASATSTASTVTVYVLASIAPVSLPLCSGASGTATASPSGATYAWTGGLGSTQTVTITTAATYTCTVTQGTCVQSPTVTAVTGTTPSAPTSVSASQCGPGIPTASVASSAGAAGSGQFNWYNASSGGSLQQGPPASFQTYYTNNFSSGAGTATLSGVAAISAGVLNLYPNSASQQGGITIPASGSTTTQLQVDFDGTTVGSGVSNMADGFSYSFADDADATIITNGIEQGSGTKLRISFDAYGTVNPNVQGIYLLYNEAGTSFNSTDGSPVLGYSANTSWLNSGLKHYTITVNASGQLTLVIGGVTIFNNVQLPPAYLAANKSTWKHVIAGRTGGISMSTTLDNLVIQESIVPVGYTTYQTSVSNTTTWYVSETGTNGCPSARTSVTETVLTSPTASASSNSPLAVGGTLNLNSSGGTSYSWAGPSYTNATQNPSIESFARQNVNKYQ